MVDQNTFTETIREVAEIIRTSAEPMSREEILDMVWGHDYFGEVKIVDVNIRRLRLKESDRVASVIAMVEALGGKAQASEDTLTVYGTGLVGGTVDAMNDHRIAMSAAIAATACKAPVAILGAECVGKSYPKFFEEYARLGGNYEQYLR